jgi:RHS repeat-associated protein
VATVTGSSGFSPGGPITYTTNFLQQVVTNYFDAAGQVLTSANALGEKSTTSFDALGRVTQAQLLSASGTLIRQSNLAYSPDYNSVTITSGSGAGAIVNTVYTDHDGNNVLSVGYPSTGVNEFMLNQFDLAGNLITQQHNSIAGGILTNWTTASFAYDGLNRVVGKLDRDGAPTAFAYDSMGDLTNQTLPGGVHWQAAFTNSGQMLKDWNVNGSSVTRSNNYAYFASGSPFAGLLQSKIDGRNTTNIFAYDDWLRVTNVTSTGILPEQKITTGWQYEPRGFVTAISEQFASTNTGPNTSITRSFDGYGQLSTETINGGTFGYSTSQGWDAAGRRNSLNFGNVGYAFGWQADGALTGVTNLYGIGSYSYTTSGLLASRMVGNRQTVIGSWDGEGRPLSITTSVNGTAKLIESLGWSADGLLNTHTLTEVGNFTDSRSYAYANLSRRVTQEQLNLTSSTAWTNTFVYDKGVAGGPGVLTSAGQAGQSSGLWNGGADAFSRVSAETNSTFAYSAYGHVNGQSTLSAWLDNQPLPITGLGTNAMQWRAAMEISPGTHQIKVAAAHPSGFYTAWTTNSFTNNISYQSTADSFDGSGNITNRVWRNASGTTNRIQTLSWDARGRLHQVVDRDATNNGYNWTAVYDSLNRRLSTTTVLVTNGVVYPAASQTLSSYFDPLCEFQELGVSVGSQTTWKLMGPDLNGQYGGLNGIGGFEGTSPYLYTFNPTISDARGNILAEVTNGAVSWNPSRPTGYGAVPGYRPAAFGSGADLAQSSALRGREVDITGYYHLGMRDYDPVNGQWLSYDPAWNSGDPNGFSYCGGDSINYTDPDGRVGKSFLNADQSANNPYVHAIHTGLSEGLANAWFSMAQFTTKSGLQEMHLGVLAPVSDFFFRDAHETVSSVFDAHTSGFNRAQGEFYAWSGFAGEMAPNAIPIGGAEVGVAKFTSFAAERFPALGQDVGRWFGQRSQNLSTWQDFLPQAQTILNKTKAEYGGADVLNMSKRRDYMGSTPGKYSLVGEQVMTRMAENGTLRVKNGNLEVLNSENKWVGIETTDMSHILDAVKAWNDYLYKTGPKSTLVRQFMTDPNNYELDSSSINRSSGASLGETYRNPGE